MAGIGGVVGIVLGWLGYQVGQRTDAAAADGSLHARVADLKNLPRQKPRGPVSAFGSENVTSESWIPVLDISGTGKLLALSATPDGSETSKIRVTVDGIVVSSGLVAKAGFRNYPTPDFFFVTSGNKLTFNEFSGGTTPGIARINFKSSLKIEAMVTGSVYDVTVDWMYELE
jgi:hypothetical protein